MDGYRPCHPERKLPECSYDLRHDLPFLIESVLQVFPLHRPDKHGRSVRTFHFDGSIGIDCRNPSYLAIIVGSVRIVSHKHDLRPDLQREHIVCRICVFREISLDISLELAEFTRKFFELHGVETVSLGVVCSQSDCLTIILIRVQTRIKCPQDTFRNSVLTHSIEDFQKLSILLTMYLLKFNGDVIQLLQCLGMEEIR